MIAAALGLTRWHGTRIALSWVKEGPIPITDDAAHREEEEKHIAPRVASRHMPLLPLALHPLVELAGAVAVVLALGLAAVLARRRSQHLVAQREAQQQRLERSEQQLRLAERVAHLGSFDWNPQSGELHWSDEHYRLWGHAPGAVVPSYDVFRNGVHPQDLPQLEAELQRALAGGRFYDLVHRVRHPDGEVRRIHARGEVTFDEEGVARRMIGTVQDVTEQMREREVLRTHQFAIDSITDMVSVVDEELAFRLVNDEWCRVEGRRRDEVVGRYVFDVIPVGLETDRGQALLACLRSRQRQVVRSPFPKELGTGRVRETQYFPYDEPDGGMRGVVMVTRDVTQAEQARAALAQSVDNLRLTLNATGDAIFASDARGPEEPVLFANDALLRLWGIPLREGEAVTPALIMAHATPQFLDPQRESARVAEIIASGRMQEDRIELRDGRVLMRRCIPTALAGRAVRVWGFRDITREEQAVRALVTAKEQAERANRAKSEFLSAMSHELRTPMNAVLGFGQLLEAAPALREAERERGYAREILRGGRHLLALINDLLDLSRIEAGHMAVSLTAVPLAPLADDCLRLVQPLARRHDVNVQRVPEAEAPLCALADVTRLRQVLINLLGNAIKYSPAGSQVRLVCTTVADCVRIEVHDQGPGLTEAQRARLFRPFERLGAERSGVEGAGIGLALSRELVHLMGGRIGVHSEPGRGCCFWVELPSAEALAAAPVSPAGASLVGPSAMAAPLRTVLYIEDNPVNLMLMEAMLARLPGVRTVGVMQPESGLDMARTLHPDLVLLDIQLPGLDGHEVLRRLRSSAVTAGLPVVAVSANAMPQDVATGLAEGFDAYLTKPLDMPLLLSTVSRLLGQEDAAPDLAKDTN